VQPYSLTSFGHCISYKKLQQATKFITKYSYLKNGKLIASDNCFFSNKDYKTFEMVFENIEKVFDPVSIIK
jgi:hypothetical protein